MTPYIRKTVYTGPVRAVVLDWAGTAVDYGCMGPTAVFVKVFERFGVRVAHADVRRFMGLAKKDHIRGLCGLPPVMETWRAAHGRDPQEEDVEQLYELAQSLMAEALVDHAEPIPGALAFVEALRTRGVGIGSCTGYTDEMIAVLVPEARRRGFAPDSVVCSTQVPAGRPYPWMCYQNAINLKVFPFEAMVKIGDTISDIHEGLNAGMWTIGLSQSGNELGLTMAEAAALPGRTLDQRLFQIETLFRENGAHYVARGIWDCLPLIDDIERRLAHGEHPLDGILGRRS